MSDTPRMQSALLDVPDAGFANIWKVGCEIERELNAANERIKRLDETLEGVTDKIDTAWAIYMEFKEPKP